MRQLAFDHLAVACTDLDEGAAAVQEALGVKLEPGGRHGYFGTHNRLLSLGRDTYLEVIAIDPDAPKPSVARWFDLDRFQGAPRLSNWILRTEDLDATLAQARPGVGAPVALDRGRYRWRMAVPPDGRLPFDNLHPALMAWDGPHPAADLPERFCRLYSLEVSHPQAEDLFHALDLSDARIELVEGPPGLRAVIKTPDGLRDLS